MAVNMGTNVTKVCISERFGFVFLNVFFLDKDPNCMNSEVHTSALVNNSNNFEQC